MANVQLVDYTGAGRSDSEWHAADVMIFTKQTRLNLSAGLMNEIKSWPAEKKTEELDYMAKTIKSSWEFADVTFLISGVSRAVAQQITRTRTASYAMQSMRVTDASQIGVVEGKKMTNEQLELYRTACETSRQSYKELVDSGVSLEDARGVLPLNTECNLICKYNFRSVCDLIKARKSLRAQGEYTEIVIQMEKLILDAWPWAGSFFESDLDIAVQMLEKTAKEIGITTGKGHGWEIAKAVDLIRKS
jgi:flavin-dependent thymidylate synthase